MEAVAQDTPQRLGTGLINDILGSAAKIATIDTLVCKQLADLAAQEINETLTLYGNATTSTPPPASKAVHLADLGNIVATAVTQDEFLYVGEAGPDANDFIGQVVALFKAAGTNAEQTSEDDEVSIRSAGGVTHNAIETASKLLFINGEAAKEILEIAYGIAIEEDIGSSMDRDDSSRRDVIAAITDSAERLSPNRFKSGFELFQLAHRYQRAWMSKHSERSSSGLLHSNALASGKT